MKRSGWLKNATAVPRGYFMATGEKLKATPLTQEFCDAWNATAIGEVVVVGKPAKAAPAAPKQESRKDPVLTEMTKDELEDLGREHGVELDKRKAKGSLIKTIKKALK